MLKFIFSLFANLPNRLAQVLGIFVGLSLYYFGRREKGIATINIDMCFPELSDKKRKKLVKSTLVENAKTLLEIPRIFKYGGDYAINLIKSVEGIEHYQQAIKDGKGVILIGPHLGNWELIIHYLNQYTPVTAMFAPPKQKFLTEIIKTGRESSGATLVPADISGVRAQLKHLKQGGAVGILPDQNPKQEHAGIFAPFMGNNAYTMLLINSLSQKSQATSLMTFAKRLPNGTGYKMHIIPAPEGINAKNKLTAATELNKGIELCIKLAPEQYQWTYKRFKIQPKGEISPYHSIK